jgi:hypothetical protein
MILLVVSWRETEKVEFFFLHDKGEGKEKIREHADDDHEEGREWERNTEKDIEQHWPDLGLGTGGKEVADHFL